MEPSVLRRRVKEAIEAARQGAAARRAASEAASSTWLTVKDTIVVPAWRQTAQVLRSEGYLVQLSTPSDAVRVTLEKAPQDGVELVLDTSGDEPAILLRVTRSRGREITRDERVALSGEGAIATVSDEQACGLLLAAMAPFFER
jgi:hypothetical protein